MATKQAGATRKTKSQGVGSKTIKEEPQSEVRQNQPTKTKLNEFSREARGIPTDYRSKNAWTFETIGMKPVQFIVKNDNELRGIDEDGNTRSMRLCKGVDTIWRSEQPEKVSKAGVQITDGEITIPSDDTVTLDFLFFHPDYGKRFIVRDNEEKARKANESIKFKRLALNKAFDMDIDVLRSVALVLGYDDTATEEEVRNQLAQYAETRPREFLDKIESDMVKAEALIKDGIRQGILSVDDPDHIKWADGGVIITIPHGKEHSNILAKYFLSQDEKALRVRAQLEEELS